MRFKHEHAVETRLAPSPAAFQSRRSRSSAQQLIQSISDLPASEWFGDQQHLASLARTKAGVRSLWRVADDHNRKLGMLGIITHSIKQRLAHIVRGAVQHDSVGVLFHSQLIDCVRISLGTNLVAAVAQCKRQQLGNLRRIVND